MKVRDLTVSKTVNRNSKEFNHLRVVNLDKFLSTYENNLDYYEPPFKILANLEEKIKYENNPETAVFCSYKPDGDVIFQLENIKEEGRLRIVEYRFDTFIS